MHLKEYSAWNDKTDGIEVVKGKFDHKNDKPLALDADVEFAFHCLILVRSL
jgi:hypothetical protein